MDRRGPPPLAVQLVTPSLSRPSIHPLPLQHVHPRTESRGRIRLGLAGAAMVWLGFAAERPSTAPGSRCLVIEPSDATRPPQLDCPSHPLALEPTHVPCD